MSVPILPLAVWQSGTNENSIPANDNALRLEALLRPCLGVSNNPASPLDGDVYLVGAVPTGDFADFDTNDIAIYREVSDSGSWYAWAPVEGLPMIVAGVRKLFELDSSGGSWINDPSITGGGGASTRFVNVALSDMTTDLATGTAKAAWFAPEDGQLVSVFIGVNDPSSSGVVRVDMNDSGGSVFTTRPAIDATEATSLTGTAAVLDGTVTFSRGDKFTFDIDDAGTDARGLQVSIEYEAT